MLSNIVIKQLSDRRYVVLELSAHAARHAPAGLAAYHAAIADLAAGVPAEQADVITAFMRAAARAAADAADAMATGS